MNPKFRAFDTTTGERYPVKELAWNDEDDLAAACVLNDGWCWVPAGDLILEQSLGLHDATGVEIFEGDLMDDFPNTFIVTGQHDYREDA